jgi:hypothetical protein
MLKIRNIDQCFFSSVEIQAGEISLIGKAIRVEQNLNIRI